MNNTIQGYLYGWRKPQNMILLLGLAVTAELTGFHPLASFWVWWEEYILTPLWKALTDLSQLYLYLFATLELFHLMLNGKRYARSMIFPLLSFTLLIALVYATLMLNNPTGQEWAIAAVTYYIQMVMVLVLCQGKTPLTRKFYNTAHDLLAEYKKSFTQQVRVNENPLL